MAIAPTPGIVISPASPLLGERFLALGNEVLARVVETGGGALLLRLPGGLVRARSELPLPAGAEVRLRVAEATPERVVLTLLRGPAPLTPDGAVRPAAAELAALLRSDLGQVLGEERAAGLARLLAAKGALPGEPALLAARFLAGAASPLALLRGLPSAHPLLRAFLAGAERALVRGDGSQLRQALARLLDRDELARALDGARAEAGAPPPAEGLVAAQHLLLSRGAEGTLPLPLLLFLPLPGGGEARVSIEAGAKGERHRPFDLFLELRLARLGPIGVRLIGHQGAAFVSVQSERDEVVSALRRAAPDLEQALASALSRPARVDVVRRPPEAPPLPGTEGVSVYG